MHNRNEESRRTMNRILLGTMLAAVAGAVVYYLYHKDELDEQLGNVVNRASVALGKAKDRVGEQVGNVRSRMQG